MLRTPSRAKQASAFAVTALIGGFITVSTVAAGPAAAASQPGAAQRTSLAYTDSLSPTKSFENPTDDLPLGSWVDSDGATHTSRVYATFDLSAFTGTDLLGARLWFPESKVTQCQTRTVEVWRTETPDDPITWRDAPEEEALLGTIPSPVVCPAPYLNLDLTTAARQALARHRHTLSIALQLPSSDEGNTSLGRWILGSAGVNLSITYNTPPATPTDMYNDGQACTTSEPYVYLGDRTPRIEAIFHDADSNDLMLTGDFAIWPANDPTARTQYTLSLLGGVEQGLNLPSGLLTGDGTYAWQVRGDDGTDQSAWTQPCYFHLDTVAPSTPAVVSANYPENQTSPGGVLPTFTFGANGSSDVIGYQFSWTQDFGGLGVYTTGDKGIPQWTDPLDRPDVVRADGLGGSATLTSMPPLNGSQVTLYVRSVDRALNASNAYVYRFSVASTAPVVTLGTQTPQYGVPFTLALAANPSLANVGVDSYTYELDGSSQGTPQTVTADSDGSATISLHLNSGANWIKVTSHSPDGWVSEPYDLYEYIDTTPTVTSTVYPDLSSGASGSGGGVGVPGVFSFSSKVPGVQSFTYSIDGAPSVTIPADSNGAAQITYTPDSSGFHEIDVYATAADGSTLDTYYYYFIVN